MYEILEFKVYIIEAKIDPDLLIDSDGGGPNYKSDSLGPNNSITSIQEAKHIAKYSRD